MDRYQAMIDLFPLDMEMVEDTIEKAIARYEYPYRDGADTEDLGEKARVIRMRCYWFEETYTEHFAFLEHLRKRDLFELTHPKYGQIKGRIESVSVRHDDRTATAEVDLCFVQDLSDQEQPRPWADVAAAAEESFVAGQAELQEEFAADAAAVLGAEASAILVKELDPTLGIVAQFPTVSLKARAWLKDVEAACNVWDAKYLEITNPAASLTAAVNYGVALPGRVIGTVARAAERLALTYATLRSSPARFLSSLRLGLQELTNASGSGDKIARLAGAQRLSLEAGGLYRDDEQARDRLRRLETAAAFDVLGRRLPAEELPVVLNVQQLERSLAEVRAEIQAAVELARGQESLKTAALALLEHVSQVKLERDRILMLTLENPLPLHLVCLRQGLPYRYAERILSINRIAHPSFTQGEVAVYGR